MKNLTFFAKPQQYYSHGTIVSKNPHLFRTSSLIRGEQIAQYLGCKYNPTGGCENDICIYVKPTELDHIKDGSYVDVIDNFSLLKLLEKRPGIGIIYSSQFHYNLFKDQFKNKSVLIPHHHCNFERAVRERKEIKNVGYLGSIRGIDLEIMDITNRLNGIGLNFLTNYHFKTRQDVINFYKQIDIQLVWKKDNLTGVTPMKITNAASFGIPTVSKQMDNFQEIDGFYIVATTDTLITEIEKLKDPDYYDSWSKKLILEMERYHIGSIAKLYKELT